MSFNSQASTLSATSFVASSSLFERVFPLYVLSDTALACMSGSLPSFGPGALDSVKTRLTATATFRAFLQCLHYLPAHLDAKFAELDEKNIQRKKLFTPLKAYMDDENSCFEELCEEQDQLRYSNASLPKESERAQSEDFDLHAWNTGLI